MENQTLTHYNTHARDIVTQYESARVEGLHKQLLTAFSSAEKILELGCGSGRDASFLIDQGFDVIATDGSLEMRDQALLYHPQLEGRTMQIKLPSPLPFDNATFDSLYSIAVLMHLEKDDLSLVFGEIERVLKSSGRFFFSVPLERKDVTPEGRDRQGRLFTILKKKEWEDLIGSFKFRILLYTCEGDGLGRGGIVWHSFLLEK